MKSAPLVRLSHQASCNRSFGGLKPGTYAVELVDLALGLSMVQEVTVRPQRFSAVEFTRPLPWINGSVTIRGGVLRGVDAFLVVRPAQLEAAFRGVAVPVQAAGGFGTWLPEPGAYLINLRVGGVTVLGHQRSVEVREGFNQIDWDIDGAFLNVKVVDWDRSAPLSFELRRSGVTNMGEPTTTEWQLEPATATMPFMIPGFASGSYTIQGWLRDRGKAPMVSEVLRFEIADDEQLREVELTLRPGLAHVMLRDDRGLLIPGAQVDSRHGPMLEADRGVYVARDLPIGPGADIRISAGGFTPVCRRVPAAGAMEVTLSRGMTRVVEFVGEATLPRPAGAIQWPGSDCGLPFSQFPWTLLSRENSAKVVRYEIRTFPSVAGVTWIPAAGRAPVPVGVSDDAIIRFVLPGR